MLKRPSQAQVQEKVTGAAVAEAPRVAVAERKRGEDLAVHPLIAAAKAEGVLSPARIVEIMNGSPWNRDAACLAVAGLEANGFTRDSTADKSRGDKTATLWKEEPGKRITVKIKQYGEKMGCFIGTIARKQVRVKVRQYMTKPTEPGSSFDFQAKYNDNCPMPMRVMVGEVLEETKGMYRMKLHGKPEPSSYCLHCGRALNHPVSVLYGIGPICGEHYHINPLGSEEELKAVMEEIKVKLANITWTGWIIKSAVEEWDEIKEEAGA